MYCDCVITPSSLQGDVLKILHSAHQGVSGMCSRAQSLLYWPGIIKDINNVRVECLICCKNEPSQSPAAPNIPDIPSTPFEYVFVDFFDVSNHHYLIAGDILSGWVEVFLSSSGTSKSGAARLISHLRSFFATFGVPVVGQSKKNEALSI